MAEEGCRVAYLKRKRRYSSYKGEISDAPPNLVGRDFHADAPNELWLTDITEFKLPGEEKAYLSPVIDCYDGLVVAWRIGRRPNVALANGSLEDACGAPSPGQRPVCHSDRGCHYRWPGWIGICERNGLARSMSRKGCSPDNAACEGLRPPEERVLYHRDWGGVTVDSFMEMPERVHRLLQRAPQEAIARLDEPQAVSVKQGIGRLGRSRYCPHPPLFGPTSALSRFLSQRALRRLPCCVQSHRAPARLAPPPLPAAPSLSILKPRL